MNNRDFDNDFLKALDNASIEDITELMENINPSEFKIPDDITKKRIENETLKRIGLERTKKNRVSKGIKYAAGIAAAFTIVISTTFTYSASARELARRLFSFIPGVGVVETDQQNYVLDEDKKSANDDISIEINYVTLKNRFLEVSYTVDMLNVNKKDVYDIVSEAKAWDISQEETTKRLADFYRSLGYEKYFLISEDCTKTPEAVKKPYSKLIVNGKEYEASVSELSFGETHSGKIAYVREVYMLKDTTGKDINEVTIAIDNLKANFALKLAQQYYSKEQALDGKNTCKRNGVNIMCDPVWSESELKVDFYTIDKGEFSSIDIANKLGADIPFEDSPYIELPGKRIYGTITQVTSKKTQIIFDIEGIGRSEDLIIRLPKIAAQKGESTEVLDYDFNFKLRSIK